MSCGDMGYGVERVCSRSWDAGQFTAWPSGRCCFSGWCGSCRIPSTFAVASDNPTAGDAGVAVHTRVVARELPWVHCISSVCNSVPDNRRGATHTLVTGK
jgi:hypothetical protein